MVDIGPIQAGVSGGFDANVEQQHLLPINGKRTFGICRGYFVHRLMKICVYLFTVV